MELVIQLDVQSVGESIRSINSTLSSEYFLMYISHKNVPEWECASAAGDQLAGDNRIEFVILILCEESIVYAKCIVSKYS